MLSVAIVILGTAFLLLPIPVDLSTQLPDWYFSMSSTSNY